MRRNNRVAELITRESGEQLFVVPQVAYRERDEYPWEAAYIGEHPRITKEFFRCKGSSLNPMAVVTKEGGEVQRLTDCGGDSEHGLPLIEGAENIYPILPELLNRVQEETGKRVVITCGHRCPRHNTYADSSKFNETSKHMIGGEVDFYVQGMEWEPEKVVEILLGYFEGSHQRYHKGTNVSTPPWYNREVFIKLFLPDEGRDADNRHPYPYIGIQVKGATYTWKKAHQQYRRS